MARASCAESGVGSRASMLTSAVIAIVYYDNSTTKVLGVKRKFRPYAGSAGVPPSLCVLKHASTKHAPPLMLNSGACSVRAHALNAGGTPALPAEACFVKRQALV